MDVINPALHCADEKMRTFMGEKYNERYNILEVIMSIYVSQIAIFLVNEKITIFSGQHVQLIMDPFKE